MAASKGEMISLQKQYHKLLEQNQALRKAIQDLRGEEAACRNENGGSPGDLSNNAEERLLKRKLSPQPDDNSSCKKTFIEG